MIAAALILAALVPVTPVGQERSLAGRWTLEVKTGRDAGEYDVDIRQDGTSIVLSLLPAGVKVFRGTRTGNRLELSSQPQDQGTARDPNETACAARIRQALPQLRQHPAFREVLVLNLASDGSGSFAGEYRLPSITCDANGIPQIGHIAETVLLVPAECPDLSGAMTLGRGDFSLNVALSRTLEPLDEAKDDGARDGLCHYVAVGAGSAALRAGGFAGAGGELALAPAIPHLDLSVYRRPGPADEPDAITEIGLTWNDSEADTLVILERFGVKFKLYAVNVTFVPTDAGELRVKEGAAALQMIADGDAQLRGPVYLSGDLSALIIYRWSEDAPSWSSGSWDLSGAGELRLEVKYGGGPPIAAMTVAFDSDTGIATGRLDLTSTKTWEAQGFAVALERSTLQGRLDIRSGSWSITGGAIVGQVRAKRPIAGHLQFTLAWVNDEFQMIIDSRSPLTAFGVTCEDLELAVRLDRETLDVRQISGSLALKHREFDAALRIPSFLVRDGELVTFLGEGRVGYRGFRLEVSRVSYDASVRPAALSLSAMMELGWSAAGGATIDVSNLTIDEAGEISSFGIAATLNSAPIELTFGATFDRAQSVFIGRFSGRFAGTASLAGIVVVGAIPPPDPFSYGYLSLEFNFGRGVPIGQSGLVLVGLNGAVGFNYLPAGAPGSPPPDERRQSTGDPRSGVHYILGGMTVGDVGGLAALRAELSLVLGRTTAVGVRGTLQVTRGNPYFVGRVTANYVLGSGAVSGDVSTSVRVPVNGSVVSISDNVLGYSVGNGSWSLRGSRLGGSLFSIIDVSRGDLRLSGAIDRPVATMTGRLSGSLSGASRRRSPAPLRCGCPAAGGSARRARSRPGCRPMEASRASTAAGTST
jgi:hypothetical protein